MADPELAVAADAIDVLADVPDAKLTDSQKFLKEMRRQTAIWERVADAIEAMCKCQQARLQPGPEAPSPPIVAHGPGRR